MKKMMFLFTILLASACAPHSGSSVNPPDDQLNAENRLMKNNLDLALRENEVIKEENKQYKAKTVELNAKIRRLNEEIVNLNQKYTIDTAVWSDRYDSLRDQYDSLQTSSDNKIMGLTAQNLELDRQMKNEISSLNSKMEAQKTSFEKTRQSLKQDLAIKKKEFEAELSSMKQTLTEKETVIASMKAANDESQLQIDNLLREIDAYKARLDHMGDENRGLTQSGQISNQISGQVSDPISGPTSDQVLQDADSAARKAQDDAIDKNISPPLPKDPKAATSGAASPQVP